MQQESVVYRAYKAGYKDKTLGKDMLPEYTDSAVVQIAGNPAHLAVLYNDGTVWASSDLGIHWIQVALVPSP